MTFCIIFQSLVIAAGDTSSATETSRLFNNSKQGAFTQSLGIDKLKLTTIDGATLTIPKTSKRLYMIDFWATWCPPCLAEIPHFIALQKKYKKHLQVVGISLDDTDTVVNQFRKKHQVNYPLVMYENRNLTAFGRIRSIPTTFILDKNLNVIEVVKGYRSLSYFETIIKKHL